MIALHLLCPAKVNLYLKVVGRRPDGYHELVSVLQPLSLADDLELHYDPGGQGLDFFCDHPALPQDESNLAVRAVQLFQRHTGCRGGLRLVLRKKIPVAAGLGGGSSDAAGVLLGLRALMAPELPANELHHLARQLGADVPFFLLGGPALARGIGEILEPLKLPATWLVLVNPGLAVSTAWVYRQLQPPFTPAPQRDRAFWEQTPPERWLHNDLEEVTSRWYPEIGWLKKKLLELGAQAALMSGSGPTVFGLFSGEAAASQAAAVLARETGYWVQAVRGLTRRETDIITLRDCTDARVEDLLRQRQ